MDIKHFLKYHAYQNIPLTFEEAYSLGCYALQGCAGDPLAQIQSIVALSALHTRATYAWKWTKEAEHRHGHRLPKNAAEQIAGVCAAVFQNDIALSEFGFLNPNVPYAIDNSGMGGDLIVTANVSTIAAFIAAAAGITMCKHGSPANADKGRHGSSDFIKLLGINTYADKIEIERCVEEESFGYTDALDIRYKRIHSQTHEFAKLPHMNDIVGPITNPLNPRLLKRRVLGVNHLISPRIIAEAYQILNELGITYLQHGIFVRGFADKSRNAGMDEVSICEGGTQVAELREGRIYEYHLTASDFGVKPVPSRAISPPRGMSKGDFSLGILSGKITGPPLMMVLANAAILFYLAGRSQDLKECYAMAKEVYEKGDAYSKMVAVRKRLPKNMGR
jgi:anthranilate phosphoribosyltransferase